MTAFADPTPLSAPIAAPQLADVLPRTLIKPRVSDAIEQRNAWQRRYRHRVAISDTAVILASAGLAAWVQIDFVAEVSLAEAPWQYGRVFVLTVSIWLIMMAAFQTRSRQLIGSGAKEYRRVVHATGMAFGALAIGFVVLQSQGMRTQLLIALPLGTALLIIGRWHARRWLVRQRMAGESVSRALVVGHREDVEYVVQSVHGKGMLGYHVVGVSLDDDDVSSLTVGGDVFRAVGTPGQAHVTAARLSADAVIIASTPEGDRDYLKRMSWQLEGTAAELVISSPIADVAGPRMSLNPIEGLPLVHVEIPTFEGGRYLLKRAMDVVLASLALIVIALLTPLVALAIKMEGPGSIFFHQERVGLDGHVFRMLKFRSMRTDAERTKHHIAHQNELDGPMFKMKHDPRITRVGAILRKYSIDELPQFWNVLIGDMSIVGPRPPLPTEVTSYDGTVYRRLYIKPGITGLWQISGRSDLDWEETVRLDLRYVENWSVIGDLTILWRTVGTVLKADGAY